MNGGGGDMFLAEFNPTGELIASTYLGGSGTDTPAAIAALANGSAAVAGFTGSPDFPGLAGDLPSGLTLVAALRIDDPARTQSPCMSFTLENGASYAEGPVAPGEIVTIHGAGIGPAAGVAGQPDAHGDLPFSLANVKVFFDQYQAPLLYVQNGQVNAIVPWELGLVELFTSQRTTVHVEYNGAATNSTTIPLAGWAPAIFFTTIPQPSGPPLHQAAVLNEDGTVNSATNPARGFSVVSLFGTGGGLDESHRHHRRLVAALASGDSDTPRAGRDWTIQRAGRVRRLRAGFDHGDFSDERRRAAESGARTVAHHAIHRFPSFVHAQSSVDLRAAMTCIVPSRDSQRRIRQTRSVEKDPRQS